MPATLYKTVDALRSAMPIAGSNVETMSTSATVDGGRRTWKGVAGAQVGAYTNNGVTVLVPSGGDGSGAWVCQLPRDVDFRWFGAVGGDRVADTAAFKSLCQWINGLAVAAGGTDSVPGTAGVTVYFPPASSPYIFDFSTESFGPDVQIHNAKSVRFLGDQTRIKVADGARVGYSTLDDEQAYALYFQNCEDITVDGFDLDGNLANLSIGPNDGRGLGVALYKVHNSKILNCNIHDFGTDGIFLWSRVANDPTSCENVTLENVRCHRNRRQGMSIGAAINTTCISCKFNDTGTGAFDTAPRAGVDLEPSFATDVVRGTTFVGCEFLGNEGAGFVSDTLAEQVTDTTFSGCEIQVLWCRHPSVSVHGGLVRGYLFNYYGSIYGARLELNSSDASYGVASVNDGAGMMLDGCEIVIDCTGNFSGLSLDGTGGKTIRNSTVEFKNTDQLSGTFASLIRGAETVLENVDFSDSGTTKSVYISVTDAHMRNCRSRSSNISFEGLNGRRYMDDVGGFLENPSSSNTFIPTAKKHALTAARTINAFNCPAGSKVRIKAEGVSVTIVDNGSFTPLSAGDLALSDGEECVLYFPTASTARQLQEWEW